VATNATVLGNVVVGPRSSIWFGAVIRGDREAIAIGADCNIQDLCVLHADPGSPCRLGDRITVGHGAVVHGASVADDALIGIRAVVLNNASIGARSIIGAGAVIPEGTCIPPDVLVLGVPGKVIRSLTDEDRQRAQRAAANYVSAAPYLQAASATQARSLDRPGT
jgi:carbonic anhydrase/acetyltransferase-like protein (isoleucine patch superfamily)